MAHAHTRVNALRGWGVIATVIALLGLLVTPGFVAAQEADQAVSPPVGGAGTVFAFFATGFDDDETVGFWLNGPDGGIVSTDREVSANDDGRADWTWQSPADAQPGMWQMVAQGVDSDEVRIIMFEINPAAPVSGTPGGDISDGEFGVEPGVGPAGTTFAFFATGFSDDEEVGYWLNAPDGSVVSSESKVSVNNDGRADWSWTSPADAQPGMWQMVARGDETNREQVIMFEIR